MPDHDFSFLDQPKETPAPAATGGHDFSFLDEPRPQAVPKPEKPNYLTQSVFKTATGKGVAETIDPTIDKWRETLEKHLPEHWKQSLGGQYTLETAKAFSHLPGEVADFISSPIGIVAAALNFTPAGPAVDAGLTLWQGANTASTYYQAFKETKEQGHPNPETFANLVVGTAASLGMIKLTKDMKAKLSGSGQAYSAAASGKKIGSAVRYLAGATKEQKATEVTQGILRHRAAEAHVEYGQAVNQLADSLLHVESLPEADRLKTLDIIEKAGKTPQGTRARAVMPTPELQNAANIMTDALDREWQKTVNLMGPNINAASQHFHVNYMPRFFKEHERSTDSIMGLFTQRPMKGSQTFRNPRKILGPIGDIVNPNSPSYNPNLHLVTSNWVELGLMKIQELKKFNMALQAVRELKSKGLIETLSEPSQLKPGWRMIEDRIIPKAEIKAGRFLAAPDEAAKSVNSFLSPSLESQIRSKLPGATGRSLAWMTGATKGFNNITSRFLVGFSLFHPILSASLSATDAMALAPMYALRRKWKQAGSSFAKGLIPGAAPIEDWRRGSKLIAHAKDPTQYPALAPYLDRLEKGGGRASIDSYYRSKLMEDFFKARKAAAIRSGSPLKGQMFNTIENLNNYVMHKIVPTLKAGAFMRMADYELDKLGPNATIEEERAAYGRVSDSIDNRHGQLIYDNVFWPRVVKDAGFLGLQFMGWTLGSYREGVGAFTDVARNAAKIAIGEKPELSHRTAWMLFGLPVVVGIMNSIAQYLYTGEAPRDSQDLAYPRTGKMNQDGTPERVSYPWTGYVRTYKQVNPITSTGFKPQKVAQGLAGRRSIAIVELWDMFVNNYDQQKQELWQSEDPIFKNISRELAYLGERITPLSAQSLLQEDTEGIGGIATSIAGVRKAPAQEMRTPAQNLTLEYAGRKYQTGPFSEEEFEKKKESRDLAMKLNRGEAGLDDIRTAASKQEISVQDAKKLVERKQFPIWHSRGSYGSQFIGLSAHRMMSVFRAASPEEKDQIYKYLFPYIRAKIARSPKKDQSELIEDLRTLIQDYQTNRKVGNPPPPLR